MEAGDNVSDVTIIVRRHVEAFTTRLRRVLRAVVRFDSIR